MHVASHPAYLSLVESAARRYRPSGVTAWQFARGKLRNDPVYRAVWEGGWLSGGALLDVGCGQGLMLALLVAARESGDTGLLTRLPDRLVGIETRARVAAIARHALGPAAEIEGADARNTAFPRSRTILLFDVLHMMPRDDQEALLDQLVAALEPEGALLIRDADASAGWRFQAVNVANRTVARLRGRSPAMYHFRDSGAWRDALQARRLSVELRPMGAGPFGNVLLIAKKGPDASGPPRNEMNAVSLT